LSLAIVAPSKQASLAKYIAGGEVKQAKGTQSPYSNDGAPPPAPPLLTDDLLTVSASPRLQLVS